MKAKTASIIALLIAGFTQSGCCKGCSAVKGFAKDIAGPEEKEGIRLIKEQVKNDKTLLEKLCGVKTKGLKDVAVEAKTSSTFRIEGKPIEGFAERPAGAPRLEGSAAPAVAVDPKKAMVCVGVVMAYWHAKEEPSGTVWTIERVNVKEVTTPGAEYKEPEADWDD